MSAPDVLWLHGGEFYDTTATAWDARNLQPLAVPEPAAPLQHQTGCWMAEWPDLADLAALCPCTADQRYARRHRAEVAS